MSKETTQNFAKTYEAYFDPLYRSCLMRVKDKEIVKDIVQDTFAKTWRYISLGGVIHNQKAFLYKTMRNIVVSYYRSKKATSLDALIEADSFEPAAIPSASIETNAEGHIALDQLSKIPEKYRDVVVLHLVKGLSFKEISGLRSEAENTVIVRFHRAIKKIRQLFLK